MSKALLVIDVQNYFMKDAPEDLPGQIVSHFESGDYSLIVFTVFRNLPDSNFVKSLKWEKCANEEDARLPEEFSEIAGSDNTFARASYSAFKAEGLHDFLQSHKVQQLVLCGVDSDACVLGSAFEAFDLGFLVDINFDLTYSSNDLHKAAKLIAEQPAINMNELYLLIDLPDIFFKIKPRLSIGPGK